MTGWIKLHRNMVDWEWYADGPTMRVFIHLLLSANHQPNSWRGIDVGRGEVIVGRKKLAEKLRLTERQVRTAINHLISTNEIATQTTNRYTLVTLLNWGKYQDIKDDNDQPIDQQADHLPTNKRPTNDQQSTTNKNEKNDKNDKNDKEDKKEEEARKNLYDESSQIVQAAWVKAGGSPNMAASSSLNSYLEEGLCVDCVLYAIECMKAKGWKLRHKQAYVEKILDGLLNQGVKTKEQLEVWKSQRESKWSIKKEEKDAKQKQAYQEFLNDD